jgi:hypothetical protein
MGLEGQEWAKIDVRFLQDPDIVGLTHLQKLMYLGMVLYSAEHLLDGALRKEHVKIVGASLGASRASQARAIDALIGVSLCYNDGGLLRIRNYVKWQLSRDQVLANRQADRQRKTAQRATRHLPAEPGYTESGGRVRADVRPDSARQEVRSKKEEVVSLSSAVELSRAAHPQGGEEDEDKSREQPPLVELVINRLAALDVARAVDAGQQIIDQVGYQAACRQRRVEANLEEITDLATRYPNWPPEQIISIVADGPLARPRVPDYIPEGIGNGHRPDFVKLREQAGLLKRVDDELGEDQ